MNRLLCTIALLLCTLIPQSCTSKDSTLASLYAGTELAPGEDPSASASRGKLAYRLRTLWYDKSIDIDKAVDFANDKLDEDASPRAANFAAALIDAIAVIESDLKDSELEPDFYDRVGLLAHKGAKVLMEQDPAQPAAARMLVTSRPAPCRTDEYWRRHVEEDILASRVLFEAGDMDEAIERLRPRAGSDPDIDSAIKDLEYQRRRKRGR